MMSWYGDGWAFWQVALMWVAMIAFWSLLIWAVWAVWALITAAIGKATGRERGDGAAAREILYERLARGEIDTEEYRRLRDLMAAGGGRHPAGTAGSTGQGSRP